MSKEPDFFSFKSIAIVLLLSVAYLLVSSFLIGFKSDQLFLVILFNACFFISTPSRKFIIGFSIFIVYWIIFDYMKAFPNFVFSDVHIADLYNAEKQLFGITIDGSQVTPNEYWQAKSLVALDIMCGFFYLCWIPLPLAFATYLFFKDKDIFLRFSLAFLLVNLLGFVIYYTYPAAPPWYFHANGTKFIAGTMGNTAGLHRFDDYFDVNIFDSIYQKSSNVFAAMPSLHSSYPMVVVYYGFKKKLGWVNAIFILITLGIWFGAVYTSHHYILDVLAGICCAITGIFLIEKILPRMGFFKRFLNFYKSYI